MKTFSTLSSGLVTETSRLAGMAGLDLRAFSTLSSGLVTETTRRRASM